jgi:hypothetical protein
MMRILETSAADLMIAQPVVHAAATTRRSLARVVRMTKCHGGDPDARLFGESSSDDAPPVLSSATLDRRANRGTPVRRCHGAGISIFRHG